MNNIIWISEKILEWNSYSMGGTPTDEKRWKRAYEIWERARHLIENGQTDFDYVDGIANLKRSLNQRLKLIGELYDLGKTKFINKPKGSLELLQSFGIIRPFIMKSLLNIRNEIEHNDAIPPTSDRCKELLDVTWYFLKSTDSIVQIRKDSAEFDYYDEDRNSTQYIYELRIDYQNDFKTEIRGWFPLEYFSKTECINTIQIKYDNLYNKSKCNNQIHHADKLDSDLWLNGLVATEGNKLNLIMAKVLSSY